MSKMPATSILLICLVVCLSVGLGGLLRGQVATGSILGAVTDSSGAAIPSATVTVTNKGTSVPRSLTTNSQGLYNAPALQAGEYDVRVEMQGFKTEVRSAQVLAGTDTTINVALTLGETREVVTVEALGAGQLRESYRGRGYRTPDHSGLAAQWPQRAAIGLARTGRDSRAWVSIELQLDAV